MDPVVLLHILYGTTFLSLPLSPFLLYPSLLYSLVCLRCASATDGGATVPPHARSCPISWFSSSSISITPRAWCAAVQPGLAACPALRGMQETTQGQSGSAILLGPGPAPVLGPPSLLACPRLGESCAYVPKVLSSSFCLCPLAT